MNVNQTRNRDCHYPECYSLTRKKIGERIRQYGFVEIADILKFLEVMCRNEMDIGEYSYIKSKIRICLARNDNGSDYFIGLRELAAELDCIKLNEKIT